MKEYPLFIPPAGISEKVPEEWSRDEAKQYFKWLLGVLEDRTSFLVGYFGQDLSTPADQLLKRLGEKVVGALQSDVFVKRDPEVKLTSAGFALAADMGLLVARLLLADPSANVKWVLEKAKRHVDYNLPVLKGDSKLTFNPIRVSTVGVLRALENTSGADTEFWLKSYLYWQNTFSSEAT